MQRSVFLRPVRAGRLQIPKSYFEISDSSLPTALGSFIHTNLSKPPGTFPNFLPGFLTKLWSWWFDDLLSDSYFLTWLLQLGVFSATDSVSHLPAGLWLQFQSAHQILATSQPENALVTALGLPLASSSPSWCWRLRWLPPHHESPRQIPIT